MSFQTPLLDGTVGVITGAASGIGKAAIARYASAGAAVIYATDVREVEDNSTTAEGNGEKRTKVISVKVDISKSDDMESLIRRIIKEQGRLDWFFANAGVLDSEDLMGTNEQIMGRAFNINVNGTLNSIQWAARGMVTPSEGKPAGGSIVVTTSLASIFGGMGSPAYTASKWAQTGLLKSASAQFQLAGANIRINGVGPGPTMTAIAQNTIADGKVSNDALAAMKAHMSKPRDLTTMSISPPEEIADVAVFLSSKLAAGVNGQNIMVDRGLREAKDPMAGIWKTPEVSPL